MLCLIVGLVIFLGAHVLPASRFRAPLVARMGATPYRIVYSVVSVVGLVLIVLGYGQARAEGATEFYVPPFWLRHVTMLLMAVASVLIVATYLPGRIRLFVRHPMVTAVMIWAFAHLLANGDMASVTLFAAFLLWSVADRISLKRREAAGQVVVSGGPWRNDALAIVIGLLVYAVIVFKLHLLLIGVPVV